MQQADQKRRISLERAASSRKDSSISRGNHYLLISPNSHSTTRTRGRQVDTGKVANNIRIRTKTINIKKVVKAYAVHPNTKIASKTIDPATLRNMTISNMMNQTKFKRNNTSKIKEMTREKNKERGRTFKKTCPNLKTQPTHFLMK